MESMIKKNLSPVAEDSQAYIYFAEYLDDTPTLYEYDDEKKWNQFKNIDQPKVKNFGLIGNGLKIYFNLSTGLFHMGNKIFLLRIKSDNNTVKYDKTDKDLITFKNAHADCTFSGQSLAPVIDSFCVGYKMNVSNVFIEILFYIPMTGRDRRPYFTVKISDKIDRTYTVELIGIHDSDIHIGTKKETIIKNGKSNTVYLYF